jgi:two-component system cell cycle sensor histidine kinase/response regulator CckA
MSEPLRVLVVDDSPDHADLVVECVRLTTAWSDAVVAIAASYDGALAAFAEASYDVAFFDYVLDTSDGLSLLREIRQRGVDTPVVVLTSRAAGEVAVDAMKAGAADYLSKSQLSVESIARTIRHALALSAEERSRRQAEAGLRASEERFRALAENSTDALMLLDVDARITYLSPSSQRHFGWAPEAVIDKSIFDFIHPDDLDVAHGGIAGARKEPGQPVTVEVRFAHADGTWRNTECVGVDRVHEPSVAAIVINARDITDRRRLEQQLRQSQKMEAVGRLAGGVAHDFNNLLTAILGYCNLMLEDVAPDHPLRPDLEEIRQAGERAAALTRQLLAFSRRQMLQPQIVDVNGLVRQLEPTLRRLVGDDIEFVTAFAQDLATVRVDPASIEQVVLNLVMNARDAMPAGGRLVIESANVELDAAYVYDHASVISGKYVMLAVNDTGQGMEESTRAKIFEPFFTTREQGKGDGLGLATVYGIVKQSGGYIWVYSEPGRGTAFKVYLPIDVQSSPPERQVSAAPAPRAWETILLVDDEPGVRALAREILRRRGYVVLEATHGLDALRVAERHQDVIHLMVSDIMMPYLGGRELAERLASVRPSMRVLFISGYTDTAVMHGDVTPGTAFLQKPFTPENFARTVRGVLDAGLSAGTSAEPA